MDFVPNPNPLFTLVCYTFLEMDSSSKPPPHNGTFLGDRDREHRLDQDGWMKHQLTSKCVCRFGMFWVHVDIFKLQRPIGMYMWKVGWKVEYCTHMVQFQLDIGVFVMSWWHILWEEAGCLWYAAMARQMLQALLYKGTPLGTKAKTAITNVRNCQVPFSTMLLLTAQLRIPVFAYGWMDFFPSIFH